MQNLILLKGMIIGVEKMGARLVKVDKTHLFFDIPKDCEIDDDDKLKTARNAFVDTFGLGLKIRRVKS